MYLAMSISEKWIDGHLTDVDIYGKKKKKKFQSFFRNPFSNQKRNLLQPTKQRKWWTTNLWSVSKMLAALNSHEETEAFYLFIYFLIGCCPKVICDWNFTALPSRAQSTKRYLLIPQQVYYAVRNVALFNVSYPRLYANPFFFLLFLFPLKQTSGTEAAGAHAEETTVCRKHSDLLRVCSLYIEIADFPMKARCVHVYCTNLNGARGLVHCMLKQKWMEPKQTDATEQQRKWRLFWTKRAAFHQMNIMEISSDTKMSFEPSKGGFC